MQPPRTQRFTRENCSRGIRESSRLRWWMFAAVAVAVALTSLEGCTGGTASGGTSAISNSPTTASAAANIATAAAPDTAPPENASLPHIDAKRAFEYTREVTRFGERYMGNENHKKLERYIVDHLKGDQVEDDAFTAETVEGKFPVRNIIAKFPGTKDGVIVILGHYDTVYSLRNAGFVGANDGGSSTAILLEFANQLRGKKRDGYSVWLVWTGREEAGKTWADTGSLYGTGALAEKWGADGTLKKTKAFLLADMIGDADLNIDRDTNSTPWLEDVVYEAATRLGYQSHFFARTMAVDDDHIPLMKHGIAWGDFIDF